MMTETTKKEKETEKQTGKEKLDESLTDEVVPVSSQEIREKEKLSFQNTELKLEPYGPGDYRLLSFLPNGAFLFEETPNEENKNISNLNQYTQILLSAIEKISKEKNKNIFIKNKEEWDRIEECRETVEKELKEFMILFDLALGSLNNDKDRTYMEINDCLFYKDIKENKQNISVAITSREKTIEYLIKICEQVRQELNYIHGIIVHKYYLCFLNQLIPHWKLLTKKYEEIDYIQNDNNFPYISEIIIEYFSLPSLFWKCSSNPIFLSWPPFPSFSPFKSQYAQINFSTSDFRNWKEKDVKKEIHKLTTGNKSKENWENKPIGEFYAKKVKKEELQLFKVLDKQSAVFIRFEGTPAHLIEKGYTIRFELEPLNVPVRKKRSCLKKKNKKNTGKQKKKKKKKIKIKEVKQEIMINKQTEEYGKTRIYQQTTTWKQEKKEEKENRNQKKKIIEERRNIGSTFPAVTIPNSIFFGQAKKVHTILTRAQWVLIDKSIFCIFAEQINNFKDKNNEITVQLKNKYKKKTEKVKIHCTQISHQSIEFLISNISLKSISGKIIPVDFSFVMLHDSMEKIKERDKQQKCVNAFRCAKSGTGDKEKRKQNRTANTEETKKQKMEQKKKGEAIEHGTDRKTNKEAEINGEAKKETKQTTKKMKKEKKEEVEKKMALEDDEEEEEEDEEEAIDYDLIQVFLSLVFSKIRDLFICAWKHFSYELPLTSADILPNMYQYIFDDYNMQPLAFNFLSWFVDSLHRYIKIR